MFSVLLAAAAATLIHIATIALVGQALGVRLRQVSFGFGPTLLHLRGWRLKLLPFSGSVQFWHSETDDLPKDEWHGAIDRQPVAAQLLVTLSGCAALFALALVLLGRPAVDAFLAMPGQYLGGALSPLDRAQTLLSEVVGMAKSASFLTLFALTAAKVAAVNLLPLPPLNGGAALAVLGRRAGLARLWPVAMTRAALCLWLAVMASWAVALTTFAVHP